jgi:adenylate kinase family enzyme
MLEALKLRTLVIGNSGSGKSSLAEGVGALIQAPIFDLDLIHWKDDGFGAKQDEDVARQRLPTSRRQSVGSSKACTGGSLKPQFQEQRP